MKSVEDAVNCINAKIPHYSGSLGIITGSGWELRDLLDNVTEIEYKDIPGLPVPSVGGHRGRLIHGSHNGTAVLLLQGRVHYYEGYSMEEVTFSVRVLSALGVKQITITNAAGGIRPDIKPGDFMLVTDHINLMGVNPLRSKVSSLCRQNRHPEFISGSPTVQSQEIPKTMLKQVQHMVRDDMHDIGDTFVDMTDAYDKQLAGVALSSAEKHGIMLHTGILAAVSGPSYETPAEIRMLSTLGADAVCMSTVPEVIMSRYFGMKVLAVSLITNNAAGISTSALRHEDVVNMAKSSSKDASRLISAVIDNMPR